MSFNKRFIALGALIGTLLAPTVEAQEAPSITVTVPLTDGTVISLECAPGMIIPSGDATLKAGMSGTLTLTQWSGAYMQGLRMQEYTCQPVAG